MTMRRICLMTCQFGESGKSVRPLWCDPERIHAFEPYQGPNGEPMVKVRYMIPAPPFELPFICDHDVEGLAKMCGFELVTEGNADVVSIGNRGSA